MAKPIKDFSLALPDDVHAALEAESESTGLSMQAVAREALQAWANRKAHFVSVYARRLRTNGNQTEFNGFDVEVHGKRRDGRK